MSTPGLGRKAALDHRDARFLLRTVTPSERPKRRTWRLDQRYDQGSQPYCVGFSWAHFLRAAPRRHSRGNPVDIYLGAQKHDEWAGEEYDGSSVRGGARYLTEVLKLVREYRWAFSVEDALNAMADRGPVVLGTNWTQDMFSPDAEGIIRYSGSNAGGHAYVLVGYNDIRGLATIHNSWGADWGLAGRAFIPYEDLEQLLRDEGEACAALE